MSRYVPKHLAAGQKTDKKRKSAVLTDVSDLTESDPADLTEKYVFDAANPDLHDIDDDIDSIVDISDFSEIAVFKDGSVSASASASEEEPPKSRAAEIYLYVQTVLESIVAAFLILTFVLSISMVIGSSMEPTLLENDRVVIMRLFYKPHYGDIIAVWAEGLPNRETGGKGEMIVKRVIGLEGDVIDIDKETGTVYRNGTPLSEDYIMESINKDNLGNAEYPVTVEENSVFVLGDNRNHSTDSRYVESGYTDYYVGCIDLRYIMGKAVFRIYPIDRIGIL